MAMALELSAAKSARLCSAPAASKTPRRTNGVVVPSRRGFGRTGKLCCSASGSRDGGPQDPIRVAIESQVASEPLVMDVAAASERQKDVQPSRESITSAASESAVESPDQVHQQAESEAGPLARESGHSVEEVTQKIEAEAEQAASEVKEVKVEEPTVGGVLEPLKGGSESALQGLGMAKEVVQRSAKVLADEAGHKASQFVEGAKRGIQELKQKLGDGNQSSRRYSSGSAEMLKHSAVDVNKEAEAKLKEQTEAIWQVMEEFVEPARNAEKGSEGSAKLGDGNEDPGDSVANHDQS